MGQKSLKLLQGRRGMKRGEVRLSMGAQDGLILKNLTTSLSFSIDMLKTISLRCQISGLDAKIHYEFATFNTWKIFAKSNLEVLK